MTALGVLIGAPILGGASRVTAEIGGIVLLWFAAAMTVQTGVMYFRASSKHF